MHRKTISSYDGTKLFTVQLRPDSPHVDQPNILWVHGAFEHCGRYEDIMRFFASKGFQSFGYDQRGHGRSSGPKMFLKSFDAYLRDLTSVYEAFADEIQGPLFVVGHSMGGLVVLRHRQTYASLLPSKATVLSSPFLGEAMSVPAWKKAMSKLVVNLAPKMSVPTGLAPEGVSRDPEVVHRYKTDPLIRTKTTPGWYESILDAHQKAFIQATGTPGPLHILMAGDDQLVSTSKTKAFYDKLPEGLDKSLKEYDGYYHEIFNDIGKEQVYNDLLERLTSYLPAEA